MPIFHMTIFHDTASASGEPMLERVRSVAGMKAPAHVLGRWATLYNAAYGLASSRGSRSSWSPAAARSAAKWVFGPAFALDLAFFAFVALRPDFHAKPVVDRTWAVAKGRHRRGRSSAWSSW